MIREKKLRRRFSAVTAAGLAAVMVVSSALFPGIGSTSKSYAATSFKDTKGHWAESYISKAVAAGFVNGYSDNTFKPDNPITRAEFTKMLNSAIGNTGVAAISFSDVKTSDWHYKEVQKGVAAGYISGRTETQFAPDAQIRRQEAAVMLARIVPTYGSSSTLKVYGDYNSIEKWAIPALEKITGKGYLGAYNDGNLHPLDSLTRAQAAKIITDVLSKETIVTKNQRAIMSDINISNTIYANDLTIDSGIANGQITLSNCSVLGNLVVEGGGDSSNSGIRILNSRIANLNVKKEGSPVRVTAYGETTVKNTSAYEQAHLRHDSLKVNGDFGKGFSDIKVERAADMKLNGDFPKVSVVGAKVDMSLESGSIEDLTVERASTKTTVNIKNDAYVKAADVYADTSFTGSGDIGTLNAYANGITYETKPDTVRVDSSVSIKPEQYIDETKMLVITPSPAGGASNVTPDGYIDLVFSSPVSITGSSSTITSDEAESIISLRRGSAGGASVSFSASVRNSGRTVRITPDSRLASNTTYYIRMAAGEVTDIYGNENELFSSSFTTGTAAVSIKFSPADNSTDVALSAVPKITFGEAVVTADDASAATSRYLQKNVITVTKSSYGGSSSSVDFTASIDSSERVVTVSIDESLEEETSYTITIKSGTLQSESGTSIPKSSFTFKTTSDSLSGRNAVAKNDDEASLSFKAMRSGTAYGIIFKKSELLSTLPSASAIKNHSYLDSVSGKSGHYDSVSVSKGKTATLDFSDLEPSTEYLVYSVLYEGSSSSSAGKVFCDTLTTPAASAPESKQLSLSTLNVLNNKSAKLENVVSADSYYIDKEEVVLFVTPIISNPPSDAVAKVTFENASGVNVSVVNSSSPAIITIPADSDPSVDPGKLVVTLSAKGYEDKVYKISIKRRTA